MTIRQPLHGACARRKRMQVPNFSGTGGSRLQHKLAHAIADLRRNEREILAICGPGNGRRTRQEGLAVEQHALAAAVRVPDENPVRRWLKNAAHESDLAAIWRKTGR